MAKYLTTVGTTPLPLSNIQPTFADALLLSVEGYPISFPRSSIPSRRFLNTSKSSSPTIQIDLTIPATVAFLHNLSPAPNPFQRIRKSLCLPFVTYTILPKELTMSLFRRADNVALLCQNLTIVGFEWLLCLIRTETQNLLLFRWHIFTIFLVSNGITSERPFLKRISTPTVS